MTRTLTQSFCLPKLLVSFQTRIIFHSPNTISTPEFAEGEKWPDCVYWAPGSLSITSRLGSQGSLVESRNMSLGIFWSEMQYESIIGMRALIEKKSWCWIAWKRSLLKNEGKLGCSHWFLAILIHQDGPSVSVLLLPAEWLWESLNLSLSECLIHSSKVPPHFYFLALASLFQFPTGRSYHLTSLPFSTAQFIPILK